VAGFVIVVAARRRCQGVRALLGLVASGLITVGFLDPALLRDEPALLVALAGTVAVAFAAVYLARGFSRASTVALAGTIVSLGITTVLAFLAAGATSLNGLTDESAQTLRVTAEALDLRGLLVAGIVVGALGVLDDVTVSQVSTVGALRRANPGLSQPERVRALFDACLRCSPSIADGCPCPPHRALARRRLLAHRVPRLGNRSRSCLDNRFLAVRDRAPIFSP